MSIIGMINNSSALVGSTPDETTAKVVSLMQLSPTQFLVELNLSRPERILNGQYIELVLGSAVQNFSIMRTSSNFSKVSIIVGGSLLTRGQVELLDQFINNRDRLIKYSIKGRAVCRSVGTHPVLIITAGSALAHAYSILNEHLQYYSKMNSQESIDQENFSLNGLPSIDFIWACKGVSEVFSISDTLNKISDDFLNVINTSILVESIGHHDESILERRKLIKIDLPSYIDRVISESDGKWSDLSNHLIYLSGSKEMVSNIKDALLSRCKADSRKIVSDHN